MTEVKYTPQVEKSKLLIPKIKVGIRLWRLCTRYRLPAKEIGRIWETAEAIRSKKSGCRT